MSISLSTITGTAQTGLTSSTYTVTADTAPDSNGKQYVVSALGGTQTGVSAHSVSSPFTLTFWRPKFIRLIGLMNSIGWIQNNPVNVYKLVTRKGTLPAAGERPQVCLISTTMSVPAGSDTYDIVSVRAAMSAHFGALSQQSAGIGDLANNGVL